MSKTQKLQDELAPLREKKMLTIFVDAVIFFLRKIFFNSVDWDFPFLTEGKLLYIIGYSILPLPINNIG